MNKRIAKEENRSKEPSQRPRRSKDSKGAKNSTRKQRHSGSQSPDEHTQTSTPDGQEKEDIYKSIQHQSVCEVQNEEVEESEENDDDFPFEEIEQKEIVEGSLVSRKILSPFAGIKRPENKCSFCIEAKDRFRLIRSTYQGGDQFGTEPFNSCFYV